MALPAGMEACRVDLHLTEALVDSPLDPDRDPDTIPIAGAKVVFRASLNPSVVRIPSADPPTVVSLAPITVHTDANGDMVSPDGQLGVYLIPSTDERLDPHGWTWSVTITKPEIGLSISTQFVTTPGGHVNLGDVVPVPPNPGTALLQWEAVVADTQAARDEALAAKGAAEDAVAEAEGIAASINPTIPVVPSTVPQRDGAGALAVGAPTAPEHAMPLAAALVTFAKTEPRDINLRELGVSPSASAAANTATLKEAIADAPAGSRLLLPYSPDAVAINDALTVPPGKPLRFAGLGGKAKITQTVWPRPVFDLLNADGSTVEDFDLFMSQPRANTSTGAGRDGGAKTYASAVWIAGSEMAVRRIKAAGFTAGIRLTNWNQTAGARTGYASDHVFEDILVTGCDWGIVGTGWRRVLCRNVSGDYSLTPGSADPAHLIYVSAGATSMDVTVDGAQAADSTGGSAYSFKIVNGLVARGLTARNCEGGFFNLESIIGGDLSGLYAVDDAPYGDDGSIFMFGSNEDVTIRDVVLRMRASQRAIRLSGSDVTLRDALVSVPHETNKQAGDIFVATTRGHLENVRVVNTGTGCNIGILVSSSAVDTTIRGGGGTDTFRYVMVSGSATRTSIEYDPAATTPKTSVSGHRVLFVQGASVRVRPARTVETFTTGGGTVQVRADQVTNAVINVTGTGNVTVQLVEPFPGATITYVVTNTTAAAMGTVTWTGHTLAAPFTSPAAGASATITFTHDGTGWREVSRA